MTGNPPLPDPDHFPGTGRILIAYSGGPDSTCLMHLLATGRTRRPLLALHVDHGLDPDSGERAKQAVVLAETLGVKTEILQVMVEQTGGGPEAEARRARYAALAERMQPDDVLLTAHHADDQVETVLLRLLRGSGPAALGGMSRTRRFGPGWLHRPLLEWGREDIHGWLDRNHIGALEDPANKDLRFDRNFIRLELLPLIEQRWPGAHRAILASARLCSEAGVLLDELAAGDLEACRRDPECLDLAYILALPRFRAGEVLRRWCRNSNLVPPPGARLESFLDQLCAAPDRTPELRWDGAALRRHGGFLWLDRIAVPDRGWTVDWQPPDPVALPGPLGRMGISGLAGEPPPGRWQIRSGQAGETIRLPGRFHRHRVRELLREAGVPPWRRDQLPRVWHDDRLVAVSDRWLDADFSAWLESVRARLVWERPACRSDASRPREP